MDRMNTFTCSIEGPLFVLRQIHVTLSGVPATSIVALSTGGSSWLLLRVVHRGGARQTPEDTIQLTKAQTTAWAVVIHSATNRSYASGKARGLLRSHDKSKTYRGRKRRLIIT
jgi:hypothetical protein